MHPAEPTPPNPAPSPKVVYWAFLLERCNYDKACDALAKVSYTLGRASVLQPGLRWKMLYAFQDDFGENSWQYMRTDVARQALAMAFVARTKNPRDTLLMFDIDHEHLPETALRLVEHDVEVVVPLMFRRGNGYEACAFRRGPDGALHNLTQYPPGLLKMDALGAGLIAIQRQAFQKILDAGLGPYYFKYEYGGDGASALPEMSMPSEDLWFSRLCEKAGVGMFVDTTLETPHLALSIIDRETNAAYLADHPEIMATGIPMRTTGRTPGETGPVGPGLVAETLGVTSDGLITVRPAPANPLLPDLEGVLNEEEKPHPDNHYR